MNTIILILLLFFSFSSSFISFAAFTGYHFSYCLASSCFCSFFCFSLSLSRLCFLVCIYTCVLPVSLSCSVSSLSSMCLFCVVSLARDRFYFEYRISVCSFRVVFDCISVYIFFFVVFVSLSVDVFFSFHFFFILLCVYDDHIIDCISVVLVCCTSQITMMWNTIVVLMR